MICFDSHAHLDMVKGGENALSQVLERAWGAGLEGVLTIAGASRTGEFADSLRLAHEERRISVAAGIHPHISSGATLSALDKLRFVLDEHPVVALGEIGLDYHYNHSPPADQRLAFVRQLQMARDVQLPVVVHTREADGDTLAILRDEGADTVGGVVHCFSSGAELAAGALELGLYLSFSGIVTFPGAAEVQEVATSVQLERILVETDSPFLSPVPHRGKVNEPARVVHVLEKLAQLRGVDAQELGQITTANAHRLFSIEVE